jgi:hypothetical protein
MDGYSFANVLAMRMRFGVAATGKQIGHEVAGITG